MHFTCFRIGIILVTIAVSFCCSLIVYGFFYYFVMPVAVQTSQINFATLEPTKNFTVPNSPRRSALEQISKTEKVKSEIELPKFIIPSRNINSNLQMRQLSPFLTGSLDCKNINKVLAREIRD